MNRALATQAGASAGAGKHPGELILFHHQTVANGCPDSLARDGWFLFPTQGEHLLAKLFH